MRQRWTRRGRLRRTGRPNGVTWSSHGFVIKHDADMAAKDEEGSSPLHLASERGDLELALILAEQGADVTTKDKFGSTPLHRASERGDMELARLIKHGADATAQYKFRSTTLHQASEFGDMVLARLLIDHGADMAAQDVWGLTPLHRASTGGHVGLARLLVEYGVDTAIQDKEGWKHDPIRLLIERGAIVAAQDLGGSTPLHRASSGGHVELVQLLIERSTDREMLFICCHAMQNVIDNGFFGAQGNSVATMMVVAHWLRRRRTVRRYIGP
jgi:ankyrin repeat protein